MPRHESVRVDLGETASFQLWLNVINLSPFEVELNRAEFEFSYASAALKATVLRKQKFAPGEIATFQISNPISDGLANQIVRNRKVNAPDLEGALSGHIEFNCKLHPFPRQVQHLAEYGRASSTRTIGNCPDTAAVGCVPKPAAMELLARAWS
ncbi:hypothetical protein [Undibacterium sp. CY21W]|uniref:hypothetical protein n=1 Tax=Undibacterium sp. CY21W TaxID=2762293 RepID=UPI00164C116B|nr:hypothetical protein [Undibacterium sp. CY21W]MBC3926953.1 hypothetical protein [Undibacterium sp. CY21W]